MNTLAASFDSTGSQGARMLDPRSPQGGLIRSIRLQAQITQAPGQGDRRLQLLQDNEVGAPVAQPLRQHRPDPPEAANDDMVSQAIDLAAHALDPEDLVDLIESDELHQRTGQVNHAGAAQNDGGDRDTAQQRRIKRANLVVADGIDRQNHHVECVAKRPAGFHIGANGDRHHHQHVKHAEYQVAQRRPEQPVRYMRDGAARVCENGRLMDLADLNAPWG